MQGDSESTESEHEADSLRKHVRELEQARQAAEEARRIAEKRYNLLSLASFEGVSVNDGKRILEANRVFCEKSGYTLEEIVGMDMFELIAPESRAIAVERIAAGSEEPYEIVALHKDGTRFPVEIRPKLLDYGETKLRVVALRDVTEQRRREERIRLLLSAVEQSSEGVAVSDLEGVLLFVNPAMARMHGFEAEELIGRPLSVFHTDEQMEAVGEANRAIREEGSFRGEIWHRRRDGSLFPTRMHNTLIRDGSGKPEAMLAAARDVTERKEAERALEEGRRFLKNVFDAIQDGLSVLDRDLNIVQVNPWMERKYREAMPLCGKKCYAVYQHRSSPCPWCPTLKTMASGVPETTLVPYPAGEAPKGWIELTAYPLRDEAGELHGVIEHVKDVTDRRRAEEERRELEAQLRHAQKLESLGVLAGGIAHDFNNLLMGVLGNADLALTEISPASPATSFLQEIKNASWRAADLCRQLLAYSGKGRFVLERVHIPDLVEEMSHLVEISISKKAALKFDFEKDIPCIHADATQVRQVLMNLITNASEALGDRPGVISLSAGAMDCDRAYLRESYLDEDLPEGRYVFVEVADNGEGMDEETKEKIFDPFFTTKFTGRGLGLAAVLGILRSHGGTAKVYSEPGKGTTFKVLFPALEGEEDAHARQGASEAETRWVGQGTILLADDEEAVRDVTRLMLRSMGFTVLLAEDGEQALEIYRRRSDEVDLVILDLTMPGLDGHDCFREMRRVRKDVPVLLSSGYNEQDAVQRFAGKGLAGFLQKPYVLETLRAKVYGILGT